MIPYTILYYAMRYDELAQLVPRDFSRCGLSRHVNWRGHLWVSFSLLLFDLIIFVTENPEMDWIPWQKKDPCSLVILVIYSGMFNLSIPAHGLKPTLRNCFLGNQRGIFALSKLMI